MIKETKIISVYSPKGGVGKTTLAKEISLGLQVLGKKVLLIDGDLEFGDVCSMFRLPSKPNIMNWVVDINVKIKKGESFEDIKFNSKEIEHKYLIENFQSGLKILPAPSVHGDHLEFSRHHIQVILNNLKNSDFDVIIIDLSSNIQDYTYKALELSDLVLMVSTQDICSLNNINLVLNTFRTLDFPLEKINLIINRYTIKKNNFFDIIDIENKLKLHRFYNFSEFEDIDELSFKSKSLVYSKEEKYSYYKRQILDFCRSITFIEV